MRSLKIGKVSQDDRYDTHEARRSPRVAGLLALPVVLVALFALCSAAPVLADESIDGLAPGVTLPPWAVGKSIHFMPYHHRLVPGNSGGLAKGEALQRTSPDTAKGPSCETEEENKKGEIICVKHYEAGLHFYGGEVQVEPTFYLIFWGHRFSTGGTLETQLKTLYNSFMTLPGGNLAYQGILTQYHGHDHLENNVEADIGSTVLFGGYEKDEREFAPKTVTDAAVEQEVHWAIEANHWPTNNPNAQFIVFTPPEATMSSEFIKEEACGNHGVTTEGNLVYAFVPYAGGPEFKGGCLYVGGNENANDETVAHASHEYAEAATDPHPTAHASEVHGWTNRENFEIGDICTWGDRELKTGSQVWVTELWGNKEGGCVLADPPEGLPPAPTVTTESATGVSAVEATVTGTVNPNESDTHYYFEYGPTTSYGTKIPTPPGNDAGFGETAVPVSVTIKGLLPGTTYHYRLVASNFVGTTDGGDHTFATTSPWKIQTTLNPLGLPGIEIDVLSGVSCWAATACTAAGYYLDTEGIVVGLVERWNGTTWEVQSTPSHAGATGSHLESISCPSSTACTATGYYENSQGAHFTLAERWNGSTWVVQTTPTSGNSANLASVSCTSATECTAVGQTISGNPAKKAPLVERWNGTEWKTQTVATPSGYEEGWFSGVSCPASNACTAVGSYISPSLGVLALAERWNGTTWSVQATPELKEYVEIYLNGVSCSAASACTAVGEYQHALRHGKEALVERWNGTSWQIQESPNPTGKEAEEKAQWKLSEVSCPSATSCVAIGSYNNSPSHPGPLLGERWNGTSWELEFPTNRSGVEYSGLEGVSCSAASVCTAVGYSRKNSTHTETLAERFELP